MNWQKSQRPSVGLLSYLGTFLPQWKVCSLCLKWTVVKFHLSLKEVQAGNVCWGNEWERRHRNLSVYYALEVLWDARGRLLNKAHPPITGSSLSHGADWHINRKANRKTVTRGLATWHTWCFGNTRRGIHPVREVDGWAIERGKEQRPNTKMYALQGK